jgi:hypothetical protein
VNVRSHSRPGDPVGKQFGKQGTTVRFPRRPPIYKKPDYKAADVGHSLLCGLSCPRGPGGIWKDGHPQDVSDFVGWDVVDGHTDDLWRDETRQKSDSRQNDHSGFDLILAKLSACPAVGLDPVPVGVKPDPGRE